MIEIMEFVYNISCAFFLLLGEPRPASVDYDCPSYIENSQKKPVRLFALI